MSIKTLIIIWSIDLVLFLMWRGHRHVISNMRNLLGWHLEFPRYTIYSFPLLKCVIRGHCRIKIALNDWLHGSMIKISMSKARSS